MKISKLMLASVFLTAAILAVVSGVVTNVLADRNASSKAANTADLQQSQQLEAQYQQREAQYQQVIQQANQQLEQANAELKTLQDQVIALKSPSQSAPVQTASANTAVAAISADKAGQIAEDAAGLGQVLQKPPELVSFQNKAAYEAVFDKGSIYVDAQSGEVLFNGTIPQKITASKAAQVASEYMKNTDILQVDQITFRDAPMYRVIFKDGMMVYMDITGQITYIQKSSPDVIVVQQASTHAAAAPAAAASAPVTHESEHDNGD